ncbi:MAG: hypothetical protein P8J20_01820 [Novosphingobium sp.]|nr:hypothetical protein [Novosphingobium sp.]
MNDNRDRGSLEGPPASMKPHLGKQGSAGQQTGSQSESQSAGQSPPPGSLQTGSSGQAASSASFDMNQPSIISLLYLSSLIFGATAIVGVILAYIWRSEPKAEWEVSHYQYLINSFWIAVVGFFVSFLLMFVLIGFLTFPAVAVLVIVRNVFVLINAQKQQPMPNPGTLFA